MSNRHPPLEFQMQQPTSIVHFGLCQDRLHAPAFHLAEVMDKSVHTEEYEKFLQLLREARDAAEITQVDLANDLGITQSHLRQDGTW